MKFPTRKVEDTEIQHRTPINLTDLPDGLLIHIFSYLINLNSVRKVCKKFEALSNDRRISDSQLEVPIGIEYLKNPTSENRHRVGVPEGKSNPFWHASYAYIDRISNASNFLQKLRVNEHFHTVHSTHLMDLALKTAANSCQRIVHLNLSSFDVSSFSHNATWPAFEAFAKKSGHSVSTLELQYIRFKDCAFDGFVFRNFQNLRYLTLHLDDLSGADFLNLVEACASNQRTMPDKHGTRTSGLNKLDIRANSLSDEVLSHLSKLQCLEELILRSALGFGTKAMQSVSELPRLKKLEIYHSGGINANSLANIFSQNRSRKSLMCAFKALQSLTLVACRDINLISIKAMLKNCRKLKALTIFARNLSDESVAQVRHGLSHLLALQRPNSLLCIKVVLLAVKEEFRLTSIGCKNNNLQMS